MDKSTMNDDRRIAVQLQHKGVRTAITLIVVV